MFQLSRSIDLHGFARELLKANYLRHQRVRVGDLERLEFVLDAFVGEELAEAGEDGVVQ